MTLKTLVVDYGKGNVSSITKGLEQVGADVIFSDRPEDIYAAAGIVLPGVGSFADAVASLTATGQLHAITKVLSEGRPFLGICLGAQLMMDYGDEGVIEVTSRDAPDHSWARGIGVVSGYCRRLDNVNTEGVTYKIPHVGWNQLQYKQNHNAAESLLPLMHGIADGVNMYFTHSYQCEPSQPDDTLATTEHAMPFPSIIRHFNAFGVQFHPEKSSVNGMQVLANFVRFVETLS